jgi:hypothetical protein
VKPGDAVLVTIDGQTARGVLIRAEKSRVFVSVRSTIGGRVGTIKALPSEVTLATNDPVNW